MKIESGHPVSADAAPVAGNAVRFVTDDGRSIFEVTCGKDGHSIEVRGVETFKVGKIVYDGSILVQPDSANVVDRDDDGEVIGCSFKQWPAIDLTNGCEWWGLNRCK